jgi:putative membrane protein
MTKASKLFTAKEQKQINNAITQAESNSSGEILPVVITASGRYDRAEDLFGLVFAMILISIFWFFFQNVTPTTENWIADYQVSFNLFYIILITIIGFVAGAALATYFPALRLPFIAPKEMEEEVNRSALEYFSKFNVSNTKNQTGILLFVSLFERRVFVYGDVAINKKISQERWQEICDMIIDGMKKNKAAEGVKKAILECGKILAKEFPIKKNDKNELANKIILID